MRLAFFIIRKAVAKPTAAWDSINKLMATPIIQMSFPKFCASSSPHFYVGKV
ncbi:hypothetical protein HMPREF9104_00812 [Lentilactobacillus kisonensis F0435]|uniref:Uncharacterized protein n=1 Tax=Lentilactobacillus kisonensis F0435 TaxID=797516 RepID=H1LDY6_9LACO|nr:hypothetical protein HMPREF9104_00812 [Lentilactobacillus kisonensis F0435]